MKEMEDVAHIRLQGSSWLELQIGGRARNRLPRRPTTRAAALPFTLPTRREPTSVLTTSTPPTASTTTTAHSKRTTTSARKWVLPHLTQFADSQFESAVGDGLGGGSVWRCGRVRDPRRQRLPRGVCAAAMGAHAQTRTASGVSVMANNGAPMRSTSVGLDIDHCAPHRDFHVHHHIADYGLSEESSPRCESSATSTRTPTT